MILSKNLQIFNFWIENKPFFERAECVCEQWRGKTFLYSFL